MYRHATLRLPCESCGTEHPTPAMVLSAHGGHVCWKCQLSTQVAAHLEHSKHAQAQRRVATGIVNTVLGIFVGGVALFAAMFAVALLAVIVSHLT